MVDELHSTTMIKYVVKSLACLLLASFVLVGLTEAGPALDSATIMSVLAAAERVDPVRFRFGDLAEAKKKRLAEKMLELDAAPHSDAVPSGARQGDEINTKSYIPNDARDNIFREKFKLLMKNQNSGKQLVEELNARNLLVLASIGRQHCNKRDLRGRLDACKKLTGLPDYETYCMVAYERSAAWCHKPDSIESPFADLFDDGSPKEVDSTWTAQMALVRLNGKVNPLNYDFDRLLDWQKTESFDGVVDILKRVEDKEEPLKDNFSAQRLMTFTSKAGKCDVAQLRDQRDACRFVYHTVLLNYCLEASERTIFWCRKAEYAAGNLHVTSPLSYALWARKGADSDDTNSRIERLSEGINPWNWKHGELLDWQRRELFDSVVRILHDSDNINEKLTDQLTVESLLDLSSVSERHCGPGELERRRRESTTRIKSTTLKNFLVEANKRISEFCKSHGSA